jgi:hypothetical protein
MAGCTGFKILDLPAGSQVGDFRFLISRLVKALGKDSFLKSFPFLILKNEKFSRL